MPDALTDRDVLVVSPHPDDAVYSCSALLAASPRATVLTVFSGSPVPPVVRSWDQQCGFADSDQAVRGRRSEDEAAFAGSDHTLRRLDLLEAPYLTAPRTAEDRDRLRTAVDRWTAEASEPLICLPVGAGVPFREIPAPPPGRRWTGLVKSLAGAPGKRAFRALRRLHKQHAVGTARTVNGDHVWVRDTVLDHLSDAAAPGPGTASAPEVLFYEDYPYLLSQDGSGAAEELGHRLGSLSVRTWEVDRDVKRARMSHYRSQLRGDSSIVDPSVLPSTERTWSVPRR